MAEYTPEQIQEALARAEAVGDTNAVRVLSQAFTGAIQEQQRVMAKGPMREVMQGATFGFGEEAEAALTGRPVEEIRQEMATFREQAPAAALGLEMAGGLVPGAGGTALLGRLGGPVGRMALSPAIPAQATVGAAAGGLYGAGQAPEGGRLQGGLIGAGLGAAGGAALTPVTRAVTRRLRPGQQAEQLLGKSIQQDIGRKLTPQDYADIQRRAVEFPEFTLAEAAGPATEELAETAVFGRAGGARQIAEEVLEPRTRGMTDRLISALEETAGTGKQYWQNIRQLEQEAKQSAAPIYDRAYTAPFVPDEELGELTMRGINTGEIRTGYNAARRHTMLETGEKLPTWNELVGETGDISQLTLEQYDWIKRGLDARYKQLVSKDPASARAIWSYRQQLVRKLDDMVPDYAEARRMYAGPMQQKEAQEAGRQIFKEDAEFTEEFVRELSQGEKDAYIVGAVQAIKDKLKNVPPEGGMPRFTQLAFDRLRNAFPGEEPYERFVDAMLRERGMQRFKNQILAGSQTAGRQAQQELAGRAMGIGEALLTGQPLEAGRRAVGALLPRGRATIPPAVNEEMARMLFAQGAGVGPALQRLQQPAIMPRLLPPITTTQAALLTSQLPQMAAQ